MPRRDEEWAEIQQADGSQFCQAVAKSTSPPGEMVEAGKYQGKFYHERQEAVLQKNSDAVMRTLKDTDKVLDIGGWAHPFNRANYVMDLAPYETRGYYNRTFARNNPIPPIGGMVEHFNENTWITRDICGREPYPFRDKELDFVICSHTLEDIRDPLWVCSEMIRIAKAGYLEVPSRIWETCRGMEPGIAGLTHHRWLIDIEDTNIKFLQKLHRIHNWRYSLPRSVLLKLTEEQSVQWMFWQESFTYSETTLYGDDQIRELQRFVDETCPYPKGLLAAERVKSTVLSYYSRATNKAERLLRLTPRKEKRK
jgi:hypothetical protein